MTTYNSIVISSGHGLIVRGAAGVIDEVDEARLVTEALAEALRDYDVEVTTFHDDKSTSQSQNLWTITDFHNSCVRDLDISVHFNAFEQRSQPVGTEVWYCTQQELAAHLSAAMATIGLIDRGAKGGKDVELHFLNQTTMPSVLLEVCFVDSIADCDIYKARFDDLIQALAAELVGEAAKEVAQPFVAEGRVSYFGGPDDQGVSPSEGLAFIYTTNDKPVLFLSYQPEGTTGLARRLNVEQPYVACRWPYDADTKAKWREMLLTEMALVEAPATGKKIKCYPADWGPAGPESGHDTYRVADISPSALEYLGIDTDDEVIVTFPYTHRG